MVSSKAKQQKGPILSEPKVEYRGEQPYAGIRFQAPMRKMSKLIPQYIEELFAWLNQHGIAPAGPPLLRYYVIDMQGLMDLELGVPVAAPIQGDERVKPGALPAGRYAALVYTGVKNGIKGNGALLDWIDQQGLVKDRWDTEAGDAFRSRYESFIDGPKDDPNPANWDTEVAILLKD